jgi:hypothetical protein
MEVDERHGRLWLSVKTAHDETAGLRWLGRPRVPRDLLKRVSQAGGKRAVERAPFSEHGMKVPAAGVIVKSRCGILSC